MELKWFTRFCEVLCACVRACAMNEDEIENKWNFHATCDELPLSRQNRYHKLLIESAPKALSDGMPEILQN